MTSGFVPLSHSLGRRVGTRPGEDLRLARWVLTIAILLELAALVLPQGTLVSPLQSTVLFKRISGYSMLSLLGFAMAFGWLRRMPSMGRHLLRLNGVHQLAGLSMLLLLALHVGARPSGFLLGMFHAMAIGLGAGALRTLLGPKAGRRACTVLLVLHIGLTCLVSAGVLLHLYFVYAYKA